MRHILVDQARRRQAIKRGGEHERVELDSGLLVRQADDGTLLDLDAALQRLEACDPQLARLVELRFFGGMTFDDVAECLGVAPITAKRLWKMAKGWLYRELGKGATDAN
jgi:RNA polymerase sigma factor (TIGR02999 family)